MTERALSERFGLVHAQATFVQAAIVASHGGCSITQGFRASDVRFYFLLFTNWMEHDVLRPDQDLDLTQVRRSLVRLVSVGWAKAVPKGEGRRGAKAETNDERGPRGARHVLTADGVVGLLDALTSPAVRRPFEETLFLTCFSASYRELIAERVARESNGATHAKRVRELLDPARILKTGRAMLTAMLHDLEQRARSGNELLDEARKATAEGATTMQIAERLQKKGPWQMNRVRTMTEMAAMLPEDITRFEIDVGMALRVRMLFEPMAAQVRAQLGVIETLEAGLTTG